MPYIGRDLNRGNYLKLDDISSSFDSSTTTFNLTVGGSAFTPGSAFAILVSVGGVIQEPESAYQVNNSEITFANAPTAQDSFFCIALGVALGIGVPGNSTVNGTQMAKPFNYDGFFYLNDSSNRVGINSSIPKVALDIIGNTNISGDANVSGILTALTYSGPISNPSGISTFYNLRVTNNLTVEGTTTTLDTDVTGVDRLEINANSNTDAAIVGIQSGTADLVQLYDGTTQVVTVDDTGLVSIGKTTSAGKAVEVYQAGDAAIRIQNNASGTGATDGILLEIGNTTKDALIYNYETASMVFGTANTERLRIGPTGISTFTEDVRIVKTSGPLLELTTNTGAADATLRLSEGAPGSTTNGGGMFYSGADNKLYITCGTDSTTKRITIQRDSGNVGVGVTVPYYNFQVNFNNSTTALSGGTGGNWGSAGVRIENTNSTVGSMSLVHFRTGDADWHIGSKRAGSNSSHFILNHEGEEKVRINSSGLVGIGTVNPTSLLTVGARPKTTTAAATVLISPASGNASIQLRGGSPTLEFDGTGGGNGQIFTDSADLAISNGTLDGAGTELVRITSAGQIGIGEETPDSKLDILHSSSTNSAIENLIHLRTDPGAGYVSRGLFIKIGRDGNYDNSGAYYDMVGSSGNSGFHAFRVSGNDILRITKDGNVGIGSTIPNVLNEPTKFRELTLGGRTEGAAIHLKDDNNNVQAGFFTSDNTGAMIIRTITNHPLMFRTNNSEKLRIANDGKVGISTGTIDPDGNQLLIRAASTVGTKNAHIMLTGDSAVVDEGPQIVFSESGSGSSYAGGSIGFQRKGDNSQGDLIFGTRGTSGGPDTATTERLRIQSGGNIQMGTAADPGNALRYVDIGNYNTGGAAGSILRLITRKSDGSSTASADIVKYKAGGLVINNNEAIGTAGYISFGTANDGGSTTQRLHINSTGQVGINTFTHADTASALTIQNGATNNEHSILDIVCNDNETARIYFSEDSTSGNGSIRYKYTNDENYMSFYTSGKNAQNERFRIENNGQLWLYATAGDNQFNSKRITTTGSPGDYFFHLSAINHDDETVGNLGFHRDTANDGARFIIKTKTTSGSNLERFRIDSTGRIKLYPEGQGAGSDGVPLYLQVKTNVTGVNNPTGGSDQTGMFRIEDKNPESAQNNRYHGLELRNRNSGDVRILNQDLGTSNGANLVFAVDDSAQFTGSGTIREYLRIASNGVTSVKTIGGLYYPVASARDGSSSGRAATSAWEIKKTLGAAARTGYYYLKDMTGTVAQWWCDMETDGGGWILIAHHGEGQMADQSTSGAHWWDATDRGGFDTVSSGFKIGGGYWTNNDGDWSENTCGQLMWDVRVGGKYGFSEYGYHDNSETNSKVVFNWGTDQAIPSGNSAQSNIPNAGNRRFNEWCYEVQNAPGYNPGNYHQNQRSNIISGNNYFTEHLVMTFSFRGSSGAADEGESGPYWMIGVHANGLHQHYEESLSGDSSGDGKYQVVSYQDTTWQSNAGGVQNGMRRLSKISTSGFCNIWMR